MKQWKRRRNQEWAKTWAPRRYSVSPTTVSTIVGLSMKYLLQERV